mmetsp:Transcript_18452/g.32066  ORF Transcript_18452/g.32066 Transcript_18452/m.32066 type:complete len:116 (+) Transcript_18452:149-496(+)|eukprot:CAMPEP_0168594718 /NCGR_PEP_ID=MMETSP0420-20121227/9053_1 /TAXON_ID=498008 /ORGANISM="Pessonella sp." /LENGTH=115 /DNA_ID=CAMNT_0008631067 /DNA_START=136 /DNA_END=483 /DNA_ORIENTATION=-
MADILNVNSFGADPFGEDELDEAVGGTQASNYVHIRIQQRNGRKTLTTASGINQEINFDKVLKVFKKAFCCNGTIVTDPDLGKVIQLQGDQRKKIAQFLIEEEICKKDQVKIHGF